MLTEFQKSYLTLVYSGHVENDKNNDITSSKVNTTAPWSHRGPLKHNLEPDNTITSGKLSHTTCFYCSDKSLLYAHVDLYTTPTQMGN